MIRERDGRLEVIVYAGLDPVTRKKRRVSRTVQGTGRDARREAKRVEADLLDEISRVQPEAMSVEAALDRWIDAARRERSTQTRDDSYLRRHIRPALGAIRLDKLTTAVLNDFYVDLEADAGLAPATVVRIHGIIAAALQHAVEEAWIAENPARRARLPGVPAANPRAPEVAVVLELLALAVKRHPDLAAFLRVDAATGMRRGEICALRASNLDLERRIIRKSHAIGEGKGGSYDKPTKTGARHPISIDTVTAEVLAAQISRVAERASQLDARLVDDPFVFTWSIDASTPWTPSSVTRTFARLRELVPDANGVQLKNLRHFVATWLLDQGAALTTVAGRLGHARTSTTSDIYAAFVPAGDREAAEMMGRLLDAGSAVEDDV